jgi:cysteine desulfurase / selenocysteine lyase
MQHPSQPPDTVAAPAIGAPSHGRPPPRAPGLDLARLRREFPILAEHVHGRPLVYLDNAATTQKPAAVLRALRDFYEHDNANVHRGVHALAVRATDAFEEARARVRAFLGAADDREIVFTRGTTEAINLVAASWGRTQLRAGDQVLITEMEHHANLVPWQRVCAETGAALRVAPVDDRGALDLDAFAGLLDARTRLVAAAHVSNALGTVNPVAELTRLAHARGALVLVDGALAAGHLPLDVGAIGCDFYALSGHKLYGPTGIGVLYGRGEILAGMPPWQTGGEMIRTVTFDRTTFNDVPHRFEAGTPHVAGAVGLAAAIAWIERVGPQVLAAHEQTLLAYAAAALGAIPGLRLVGTAAAKTALHSFVLDGLHPHDVATVLDDEGVAVRAGDQCAQPLMRRLGLTGTVRASFAAYNGRDDVDRLVAALGRARELLD